MRELSATGISKRFGGNQALVSADVRVSPGRIVGLIGPNGSGKSTLLNCLSGVHRADSGTITLGDQEIGRRRPETRARLGIARTFQHDMSFPGLTVEDNLRIALDQRRGTTSASALADYVGLPHHSLSQPAAMLSWGQGRMLGIAMAMAMEPTFILLDEPLAGLQRMAAEQIIDVLRHLRDDGLGLLIVEHEMSLLLPICDQVVVLANGQVIAEGTPEDVLANPEVIDAYFGTAV